MRSFTRRAALAGLSALPSASLGWGADSWQKKDPSSWSRKEINAVLEDSPWARPVAFPIGQTPTRIDQDGPPSGGRLVIRWASARPVKEALFAGKLGEDLAPDRATREWVESDEENYLISVVLSDPPFLSKTRDQPAGPQLFRMLEGTELRRKGKPPLRPTTAINPPSLRVSLVFVFRKNDPITVEDGQVSFVTIATPAPGMVEARFKPKEMFFQGQLAV